MLDNRMRMQVMSVDVYASLRPIVKIMKLKYSFLHKDTLQSCLCLPHR